MPTRYCLFCWTENAWDASRCVRCDAPLMGPEVADLPYIEKLLLALHHVEPETRARAAALLARVGQPGDERITAALIKALHGDLRGGGSSDAGLQVEAALALGRLEACVASAPLRTLALSDDAPLVAGLAAVEALATLAHAGCAEAHRALEDVTQAAGRTAIQIEASTELAQLYEPR